ncbi:MAG: hypothetical protein ACSLE6_15240 [Mycobacterium sp.]
MQADQDNAALRSLFELADPPADQSEIALHFGPTVPDDTSGRWLQPVPGRGWFAYLRCTAPTSPRSTGVGDPAMSWQARVADINEMVSSSRSFPPVLTFGRE